MSPRTPAIAEAQLMLLISNAVTSGSSFFSTRSITSSLEGQARFPEA